MHVGFGKDKGYAFGQQMKGRSFDRFDRFDTDWDSRPRVFYDHMRRRFVSRRRVRSTTRRGEHSRLWAKVE